MNKAIILDPQPLTRKGIEHTVNEHPSFTVCGLAGNSDELYSILEKTVPNLIIFDFPLPDTSGPVLVNEIHAAYPDIRMIVLSPYEDQKCIERTMQAGANGYVGLHEECDILHKAMDHVINGGFFLSSAVNEILLRRFFTGKGHSGYQPDQVLSAREMEVFEYMGHGIQTENIAELLNVSKKTVESYRLRIKKKLNVEHITELIAKAVNWVKHHDTC